MNCTIQDIAHELNISRNTVSKALNGKGGVSEETKRLIFEKAREMNYRNILNETSVPASSSSQGTILFLTKASADYSEFWVNVMKGIESVLTPCGYTLTLGIITDDELEKKQFPPIVYDTSIQGIIMVEICSREACETLIETGIPCVTVDMPKEYENLIGRLDIITMENKSNVRRIVKLLASQGKRRFSFAGDIYSYNVGRGFQERCGALCEALNELELPLDQAHSLLYETNNQYMDFPYLVNKLKSMEGLPDVYICGNDWTAIQVMHAMQFLGHRIPEEVAFVGFDDINQSAKCNPPLTTIHTPKEQLGIAAANCLLTRIRSPKTPCVFSQYSTELIIRESTDI